MSLQDPDFDLSVVNGASQSATSQPRESSGSCPDPGRQSHKQSPSGFGYAHCSKLSIQFIDLQLVFWLVYASWLNRSTAMFSVQNQAQHRGHSNPSHQVRLEEEQNPPASPADNPHPSFGHSKSLSPQVQRSEYQTAQSTSYLRPISMRRVVYSKCSTKVEILRSCSLKVLLTTVQKMLMQRTRYVTDLPTPG